MTIKIGESGRGTAAFLAMILVTAAPAMGQELSDVEIEQLHVQAQRAAAQGDEEGRNQAIEIWTRIVAHSEAHEEWARHAVALNNMALVEHARGASQKALEYLAGARESAERSGHAHNLLTAFYNTARVLDDLGLAEDAVSNYERALEIIPSVPGINDDRLQRRILARIDSLQPEPDLEP